ncbi:MAG: Mrp/NBP35 family ATP-binding protein, partial [Anaerolineae bacterium]|nr:Mrp/NBP35 family ATP-binding protein [Anaerolineae bacterium]
DAPLSLAQQFPVTGAVIVTQPQSVAVSDALRSVSMFDQLNVPVLGIVENMAGEFFGTGGGERLAAERNVPFLGRVPLQATVREGGDYGRPVVAHHPDSASFGVDGTRRGGAHQPRVAPDRGHHPIEHHRLSAEPCALKTPLGVSLQRRFGGLGVG